MLLYQHLLFSLHLQKHLQNEGISNNDPEEQTDRRYYKRQLDKARGREGRTREVVSLNKFMEELGNK